MTKFAGIRILAERDTGNAIRTEIGIIEGQESEAAGTLHRCLRSGAEITLRNLDLDEEQEGAVSIMCSWLGYYMQEGGHHWQGEWKRISREAFLAAVIDLARFNRGRHVTAIGFIDRIKRRGLFGAIFPTKPFGHEATVDEGERNE